MASFTALNILPDSDSENEIDTSEEIRIEEALKLYQVALKLHTEGKWDEANQAYEDLFQSEIFGLDVDMEEGLQIHPRNRNVASSLPLVHYLSFKNHGAFKLDRLRARIATATPEEVQQEIRLALEWFATALERDSGDSTLWRETAQLALVLKSARLARFALESVLDYNTVGASSAKDALGLIEGGTFNPEDHLALVQLRGILERINDTESLRNPVYKRSKRKLKKPFTKFLNPLPWLPIPPPEEHETLSQQLQKFSTTREELQVESRSWWAIGQALLSRAPIPREDETPEPEDALATSGILHIAIPASENDNEGSRDTSPEEEASVAKSEAAVEDTEDVQMADTAATTLAKNDRRRSGSTNRKRKSTSMGIDTAGSRLSKRQMAKKDAEAAAAAAAAAASTPESKSRVRQNSQDASDRLFNTVEDLFAPFNLSLGTVESLRISTVTDDKEKETTTPSKDDLFVEDFKTILQTWDDSKGNVILYGEGIQAPAEAAQGVRFLEMEANMPTKPAIPADEGLRRWVKHMNAKALGPEEMAFEWLKALTRRSTETRKPSKKSPKKPPPAQSDWMRYSWPDALKSSAVEIARSSEDILYRYFKGVESAFVADGLTGSQKEFTEVNYADVEWAETILELYLDDLEAEERLRSDGDITHDLKNELDKKRERVARWAYLVGDLMQCRPRSPDGALEEDQLTLRFLWATAIVTGFCEPSREFRLACFEDLKHKLAEHSPVDLPNSTVMPEVSVARADREISKLKTVDFFNTIFMATSEASRPDPEDVIDILEAVLKPGEVIPYNDEEAHMLEEINRFLEGSSGMFKLNLWEKLKSAYQASGNKSRMMSCTLKCIEILMKELIGRNYLESAPDHRQFVLLRSLRLIETMVEEVVATARSGTEPFDKLSPEESREGLSSAMGLLRMLHCFSLWEGAVVRSEAKASDLHSYRLVQVKFRELLVRTWVMTYYIYAAMLRQGLGGDDGEPCDEDDQITRLANFLRALHEELGPRHYCKLADHLLLRVMFDELVRFNDDELSWDLLQCIQCRYHIVLCADKWSFSDHKTDPEPLTRESGMQLLDFILSLASQKKVHQLPKSDIKLALDKLVEVVGVPGRANNGRIFHNEAVIEQYWKSSIHPLKLFNCLRGDVSLSTVDVHGEFHDIAEKELYFLQGKIALHPLRYVKKTSATKKEDMETAQRYFYHDLVCRPDNWETWYRLAQVFEIKMEEEMTWSAEGINTQRQELVALERRSILCYMMAASTAQKFANQEDKETLTKISEMFTDFGYRVYAASRAPMAKESFWIDGFEKRYSGHRGEGMYIGKPHPELTEEMAWKMALLLFQNAIDTGGEGNWKNHYMKGKAQGKLYNKGCTDVAGLPLTPEGILETFSTAIACAPEKHGSEILFEPHQKLISSTIKFVLNSPSSASSDSGMSDQPQQQALDPVKACEILKASFFTKRVDSPPATDRSSFVTYVMEVLRKMRVADKAKWHHRMTSRLAHLIFDELHDVALAKAEFSTLFQPKSCSVSIWKPEFERAGRHYYYASQYNLFYCQLLELTADRASLELMAKKVRKNTNGLFRHPDVWHAVFQAYMKVLRKTPPPVGPIPNCHEDEVFKSVSLDEFTLYSARLEAWAAALPPPNSTTSTTAAATPQPGTPTPAAVVPPEAKEKGVKTLDLLREVFELRKLNAALTKTAAIDDLLVDVYAKLYEEIVPSIKAAHEVEMQKQQSESKNPMSLKNLMSDAPPVVEKDEKMAGAGNGEGETTEAGKKRSVKVPRRELISKAAGICKEIGLQMGMRQEMLVMQVGNGPVGATGSSADAVGGGASGRTGLSTTNVTSTAVGDEGLGNGNAGSRRGSAVALGVSQDMIDEGDSHMADGEEEDDEEEEEEEGDEADQSSRMEVDE